MFKKIFVVLDPQEKQQMAFDRAAYLARATGASLHLFVCTYDVAIGIASFLSGKEKKDIINKVLDGNREMAEALANQLQEEGIDASTEVIWDRHPAEAIIRALKESECDLLLKKAKEHRGVSEVIFSHMDWNILRLSNCPVLLVKNGQWNDIGQVLASVNAAPEDDVHRQLNRKILETSRALANSLKFNLHLVSAYPAPPSFVPISGDVSDPISYRKKMTRMVSENIGKVADEFGVEGEHVHLVEGPVDWVIPKVSQEIVSEFVVMGTVARKRMGGLVLGNTAEHILDELNCDVLVLKSDVITSEAADNQE